MPRLFAFLQPDARTLKVVSKERQTQARYSHDQYVNLQRLMNDRTIVVILDTDCPAASTSDGGLTWTLGSALGVVWVRKYADEDSSIPAENTVSEMELVPFRQPDGSCSHIRIF